MSDIVTSGDLWTAIGRALSGFAIAVSVALYLLWRSIRMQQSRIDALEQRMEIAEETHDIVRRLDEAARQQTDAIQAMNAAVLQLSSTVSALHIRAGQQHPDSAAGIDELRADLHGLREGVEDIRRRLVPTPIPPPRRGPPN